MDIVSVDWDYFFPNTVNFDWGHRENMFFIEPIWSMRAGARDLITGKWALDVMRPRQQVKHFWDMFMSPPQHLVIAESHLTLLHWLRDNKDSMELYGKPTIWNFDAHHDLGYGFEEENCGNWALVAHDEGLMEEYKLVYPQWRFKEPEATGLPPSPDTLPFEYFYEPPEIEHADIVFICRSGSWTPTWADAQWMTFINHFKRECPMVWATKEYTNLALRKRGPNLKEAKVLRKEHEEMLKKMMVGASA